MQPNAYPRPPSFTWDPVQVRDALPVYPPPEPLALPSLPSALRKPAFGLNVPYTLTTHLFPACYLRTTRLAPEPKLPPPHASKEERQRILAEALIELDALHTSKVTDGYPRVLWNCANRYMKDGLNEGKRTGVTLFLAHANGFPKEIWEPMLGRLLSSPAATFIDEVWAWESVQHGDAAIINAPYASGIFDWYDNGRDIANFFLYFLPSTATGTTLPVHLSRLPAEETDSRVLHGFSNRKIVAVGHSYGGCTSSLAASLFPTLFTALYLIDPVIAERVGPKYHEYARLLTTGALARRDAWASRQEAFESFNKSPFFRAWDPAVLKVYVECGLYSPSPQQTKLKTPAMQEAVVFAEVHTAAEVFQRLSTLDERIYLRWVMPGRDSAQELGGPGANALKVWIRPGASTNVKIKDGGHLIPQEAPKELADDLEQYLIYLFASGARPPVRSSL